MENRVYLDIAKKHFSENRQMLFIMGPRQIGKTSISKKLLKDYQNGKYFTWDSFDDQKAILEGPAKIAKLAKLDQIRKKKVLVVFDELHKFREWKNFLKGFFDSYEDRVNILVTGSSRLDIYRKGGDSLMGRYFVLRVHPFSIREISKSCYTGEIPFRQKKVEKEKIDNLLKFGGFPEPYLKKNRRFYNKWKKLRYSMLFKEDLRELSRIQEIGGIELLAEVLRHQIGELTTYSSISKKIRVSIDTVRRWIKILQSFYYCFEVRPWHKNVTRSLLKEPKFYLWDWSLVDDEGFRFENFIASHLLKLVHYYEDLGYGECGLYFLRNKDKKEVDFVLVRDGKPWFIVEAKLSAKGGISKNLFYYKEMLGIKYGFCVVRDMDYVDCNCFDNNEILKVPASTFLSQLV